MARISTYQHDAVPHADDNVIGTNQSPGHANETVLFSLANLSNFLLVDYPQQQIMDDPRLGNTTVMIGDMAATNAGTIVVPRTLDMTSISELEYMIITRSQMKQSTPLLHYQSRYLQ